MTSPLNIAIVGAGIGGLAAANALHQAGHRVTVYEQSRQFLRVGADINLTPNAVRALDGLGAGIAAAVRASAARPTHRISRTWDSGAETSRLTMGDEAERKYGAPQLTIHRADLLAALADAPAEQVRFGKRAQRIEARADGVSVRFEDDSEDSAFDVLVGADGIHDPGWCAPPSSARSIRASRAWWPSVPWCRPRVQHVPDIAAFTKWWGPTPESQIVTFPLNQGRDTFIFATAQASRHEESWTTPGSVQELRGFTATSIPTRAPCSTPATACSRPRCTSATRWRTGPRMASRCWAMPATP